MGSGPAAGRVPAGGIGLAFDRLAEAWETPRARRIFANVLILAFLGTLVLVEVNRRVGLPGRFSDLVGTNHFAAVGVAFSILLVLEVLALVFALADSVADSAGKQFELFSLILLRKAFLEFGGFGEPMEWAVVVERIPVVLSDMGGALLVFALVGLYYRVQRHRAITMDERDQDAFIGAKKIVALLLLIFFAVLAALWCIRWFAGTGAFGFFEVFYTGLVFTDILIVLISLRYSASYAVIFRNSGFAAATVMIRLALTAPEYWNALIGAGAATFAVLLSIAYNAFAPTLVERTRGT